jgi:hypothetical protein
MKIRVVVDVVIDGQMCWAGEVVDTDEETVKFLIHTRKARAVTGQYLTPDLTPGPSPEGEGRKRVKRVGIEVETAAMKAPEER